MSSTIRVVSIMEAAFVTGPAKNLIEFAGRARTPPVGLPAVDLSIVTYERDPAVRNAFVDVSRERGLTVDLIREQGRFDRQVLPQLRKIIDLRNPDIIQTHNVKSHFLMRWSGLWRERRWLAFHHGYVTTDLKMRLYNKLDRWSLHAPAHVVTVCRRFSEDLEGTGIPADRLTVRHNSVKPFLSVTPGAVEEIRAAAGGKKVLITVGRLSHEKGHVDLLQALQYLRNTLGERDFHLLIVGEGPERARIEQVRQELALEDCVTLTGLQHNVAPYYAAANMVVMPSHSEGSPNALLEAMIAEVPVVANAVGGISEIAVDGESALLVRRGDMRGLAEAIARLIRDQELGKSLAVAARRIAETDYSPDAYYRSLLAVYERLLNRPQYAPQPVA